MTRYPYIEEKKIGPKIDLKVNIKLCQNKKMYIQISLSHRRASWQIHYQYTWFEIIATGFRLFHAV